MKKFTFFLISVLLIISSQTYAHHILGGTINYKFISSTGESSTYRVTLELYSTCFLTGLGTSPIPNMRVNPEIELYKGGVRMGRPTLNYVPSLSREVTPLCPDYADSSTCVDPNFDQFFGVMKYVYSNDVVLDGLDANWSFVFNGFLSRAAPAEVFFLIDNANVVLPATGDGGSPTSGIPYDIMHLEATLNNIKGPNNSTVYTSPPIPFYCKGKKSYYGMGAVDEDHDILKFKLIPAKAKEGTYLNPVIVPTRYYDPPFNGIHPLPTTADNFSLNPANGQMVFIPDSAMICLVVVQTEEYRDGEVVGTTMRQMTFFINDNCDAEAATTQIANIKNADHASDIEGNLFLSACEGLTDTASFDINVSDPNNDNVTVTSDNVPAAANIAIEGNGTQNPIVHFKWNLTDAPPANYFFYLTYTDDGCPIATKRNVAYTFTVVPHNIQFESTASGSCAEFADGKASVKPIGNVSIDYNYKWLDATGNIIRNVNSSNGDNMANLSPGTYKVRVRNQDGCGKNILVTIDTTFPPKLLLPNDSTVCEGMPILLSTQKENDVNYQWSTGDNACCIYAKQTGNYTLTASNHCGTSSESVTLDFVKCSYCFFVPNAFSPNGDGQNDLFEVTPTCLFQSFKIQIFNREGRLMFVSYSLNDSWNGTYKGKELAQATYYYVIEAMYQDAAKGKLKLTGDVTLLR